MRQEDAGGIAFDQGEIPKEETTLTIVATDADFKFGDSHKVKDANAQKIAVMVFNSLGIRREKWSNVSACRTIFTVTKGSPSVARGQFEHERPSVLTGAQMPEPNVREILRKADKLGQGVSALLKFSMVMFREGDTGPGGETGRREMISVEVGIKGEENDFRCLGRSGVMMADRDDPTFTVQVQPPGAFDIDHPQWKKVAAAAVAKGLKPSFNGVLPNILHVMPGHAFGVSAHSQADSVHIFQVEMPMGQELPDVFQRALLYPTGQISHADHGQQTALLSWVLVRFMLDGKAINGEFYTKGGRAAAAASTSATHKAWKQKFFRMRQAQLTNNQARRMPRRVSPRLSESAKRRRMEASRGGRGSGPGGRALAAMTAEAAGSAAGASQTAAAATTEAEDPLSTQDQQTVAEVEEGEELEDLDLAEGMDTAEGANNNDGLC